MKKMILTVTLFATVNVFAGAYNLECNNADKSVTIAKGTLTVEGVNYDYYNEYAVSRLMGSSLVDFLKTIGPKVVVSEPNAPSNVAQSGVKVTSTKKYKDECGNVGTETKYNEAIGIYNTDGSPLVNVAKIKCVERILTGHCR